MMKNQLLILTVFAGVLMAYGEPLTLESGIPDGSGVKGKILKSASPVLRWEKKQKYISIPQVKNGTAFSNEGNAIRQSGAISMWIKPDWNGDAGTANYYLFSLRNKAGQEVLPFWFWVWLRADIPTDGGKESLNSRIRNGVVKGDWMHIFLSWNQRYRSSLYVNGQLLVSKRFTGTQLNDITTFFIGSNIGGGNQFNGLIEDFRIYRRSPSESEIRDLYFSRNIFDFTVDRTMFAPGRSEISFTAAPLGTFSAKSYRNYPEKSASGTINAVLSDADGKVVLKKSFGKVSLDKIKVFNLGSADLKTGEYYLKLTSANQTKKQERVFRLIVTKKLEIRNSADGDLRIGKEIFSHTFKKFEAGSKRDNNIFCEVTFPQEYIGRQCVIEITYPDDRSRCMAWYMHTPRTSKSTIRDRLGAGVYTGEEFPVSGKDRKMRFLFEIGFTNYLFEARTLVPDRPAAVRKIAVYTVDAPLPAMKVDLPAGFRGRQIGHMDEDQTFDYNLGWDNIRPKLHKNEIDPVILRKLIEYLKYTGQNFFSLPLLRYKWSVYSSSTLDEYNGTFPFRQGSIPFIVETLADHGITFVPIINFYSSPRFGSDTDKKELEKKEFFARTKDGVIMKCAPFDEKHENSLLDEVESFLIRFGKLRGMRGIDLWLEHDTFGFRSLENGYDDTTVNGFTAATGIKVPEFNENIWQNRYNFLTSGKIRDKWVKYRVDRTTALLAKVRKLIDRYNPELELYITVSGTAFRGSKQLRETEDLDVIRSLREEHCVDVKVLQKLPRTFVSPMRFPLIDLWHRHWDNSLATGCESMWNRKFAAPFLRKDLNFSTIYRYYFEYFAKTPMNDKYPGFFQNSDPKPSGRNYLKEFALTLALTDASRLSAGAQPFAALGCEELFREFAGAYRVLPEARFRDVPLASDPVTVRFLPVSSGTYVYAVNMIGAQVELQLPEAGKMTDLVTGKETGNRVTLKEYELKSFFIKDKIAVKKVAVKVDPAYAARCRKEFAAMKETVELLTASGSDIADAVRKITAAEKALKSGKFAEFDRLLWSKSFRRLAGVTAAARAGYLKQSNVMLAKEHIAVNCGSSEYWRSRTGKLFFPDQPFVDGGKYGYLGGGSAKTITRNADAVPDKVEYKELLASELFDISGYQFAVSKGTYDLTLYLRVGYEPSRKPGKFIMDILVNGKSHRKNFDIFTNEKDGIAIVEIKGVTPDKNGKIIVGLTSNVHPTARMLNGIELKRR